MQYLEEATSTGLVFTVKSWRLMSVVMMENDGSSIQWDSGCASATSFYEFTWRSLELLSERNFDFGPNAKGRATAVNPLLLFSQHHTSGTDLRKFDSNTVENRNGRTISWYVFPLFGWLCQY